MGILIKRFGLYMFIQFGLEIFDNVVVLARGVGEGFGDLVVDYLSVYIGDGEAL